MSTGGTVVVADDDADIRALIVLSVTRAGAIVAADVSTGIAALHAIKRCVPDLAILDISMPEMTGLQVCRAVRADPATSDVPHTAAVGRGSPGRRGRGWRRRCRRL